METLRSQCSRLDRRSNCKTTPRVFRKRLPFLSRTIDRTQLLFQYFFPSGFGHICALEIASHVLSNLVESMAQFELLKCQLQLFGLPPFELVLAVRRPIFRLSVFLYLVFSIGLTILVIKFKGPNSALALWPCAAAWFGLLILALKVEFRRITGMRLKAYIGPKR